MAVYQRSDGKFVNDAGEVFDSKDTAFNREAYWANYQKVVDSQADAINPSTISIKYLREGNELLNNNNWFFREYSGKRRKMLESKYGNNRINISFIQRHNRSSISMENNNGN